MARIPSREKALADSTNGSPKFSRRAADLEPWRYRGYPAMSKGMASDGDFFVLRRFSELSARVLLRLQDQIVELEERLQRIDRTCVEKGSNNGTFRYDPLVERQSLMDELTSRLERYQRFLLDHAQLKARPGATGFQISNVRQWLENANEKAIRHEEKQFIHKERDLIPVVSKTRTLLRKFIDNFTMFQLSAIFRDTIINQRLYGSTGDFEVDTTVYYKDSLIDKTGILVKMILRVAIASGCLWWLICSTQDSPEVRRPIISKSFVGNIISSMLTVGGSLEFLAGIAASAAVVAIFKCVLKY